ncbi:phosphomevalonate kinase [Corynebacterium sp. H78]|uniref:phosphomevalonate kinase n=1 Tax=Corynebacterium sp. H78 TaxID=3133417 RepID=UPI0030A3F528
MAVSTATGRGCGKLYIVGEYAVMDPQGLAVLAGVDRFLTATVTPSLFDDRGRIYSSYYGADGREFFCASDGRKGSYGTDIAGRAIELAYGIIESRGAVAEAVDIRIDSGLDDSVTGKKYGLGSSGAVAVAVIRAVTAAHGVELSALEVFKAAYVATVRAGAKGSAGDIACSSHGGVVLYRRPDVDVAQELIDADPIGAVFANWPGLILDSREDLAGLDFLVGWTGTPVKTDEQLAAAEKAARNAADATSAHDEKVREFVDASATVAKKLWEAARVGDREQIEEQIRCSRKLLAGYADLKGLQIETPLLASLADIAAHNGAVGKSSGAGGGDCGIALAGTGADTGTILAQWCDAGIEPLALSIAPRFSGTALGQIKPASENA